MSNLEFRCLLETSELQILSGGFVARPNRQDVLNALKTAGYESCYLNECALKTVLETWPSDPVWVSIGERRHANAEVFISHDAMSASLELTTAQGGMSLSTDLIVAAFNAHGLVYGIRADLVNELMGRAQALSPGHSVSGQIAFGTEPTHGEDTQFVSTVSTLSDRILAPRDDQEGEFDFRDFGDMPFVEPDTIIMTRLAPTLGTDGKNVLGKVINANAGKEYPFAPGAGTAVSSQNPNQLIATRAGLPIKQLRGLSVEDVYTVKEVNLATGHIHFEGNVSVQNDVARNMQVTAGRSLHIGGFVDSASVESKEEMVIGKGATGGLAGNLDELITEAKAGGDLWVQFAQFSKLHTQRNLVAEKLLFHCRVGAQGAVRVGPEGVGKGRLVGGEITAEHWIKTDILGDENQVPTVLRLNLSAMEQKHEINELQKEIEDVLRESRGLKAAMDKPQMQSNPELLQRVRSTYKERMAQMMELEVKRKRLLDAWEAQLKSCVVIVTKQIFPGVEVTIADKTLKIHREHGPGSIKYDGDRLSFYAGEVSVPRFNP